MFVSVLRVFDHRVSLSVYDSEVCVRGSSRFVQYVMQIVCKDADNVMRWWTMRRRFSEFAQFHEMLEKIVLPDIKLPQLPAKSWRRHFTDAFRRRRAEKLQRYLDILLSMDLLLGAEGKCAVMDFLEVCEHIKTSRDVQSSASSPRSTSPRAAAATSMGSPSTMLRGLTCDDDLTRESEPLHSGVSTPRSCDGATSLCLDENPDCNGTLTPSTVLTTDLESPLRSPALVDAAAALLSGSGGSAALVPRTRALKRFPPLSPSAAQQREGAASAVAVCMLSPKASTFLSPSQATDSGVLVTITPTTNVAHALLGSGGVGVGRLGCRTPVTEPALGKRISMRSRSEFNMRVNLLTETQRGAPGVVVVSSPLNVSATTCPHVRGVGNNAGSGGRKSNYVLPRRFWTASISELSSPGTSPFGDVGSDDSDAIVSTNLADCSFKLLSSPPAARRLRRRSTALENLAERRGHDDEDDDDESTYEDVVQFAARMMQKAGVGVGASGTERERGAQSPGRFVSPTEEYGAADGGARRRLSMLRQDDVLASVNGSQVSPDGSMTQRVLDVIDQVRLAVARLDLRNLGYFMIVAQECCQGPDSAQLVFQKAFDELKALLTRDGSAGAPFPRDEDIHECLQRQGNNAIALKCLQRMVVAFDALDCRKTSVATTLLQSSGWLIRAATIASYTQ